jgi:chromosome partitioning protein
VGGERARTKCITVAQRKGGVGKTTIAVSLAAEIRQGGAEVVLVDADPLRSASQWAELGNLRFPVHEIAISVEHPVRAWALSVKRIDSDYVVIDTPPTDVGMGGALSLADVAVIPCLPSGLDLEATARTLEIVQAVRAQRADDLQVILVPNRVDSRTLEGRQLAEELERFGEHIAPTIGSRTAFVRSFSIGKSIGDLDPNGPGTGEIRELLHLVEICFSRRSRNRSPGYIDDVGHPGMPPRYVKLQNFK